MKPIIRLSAWLVAAMLFATPVLAADMAHKLVIHVDENDKARMNLALNNASNVIAYYQEKGEDIAVELVAYGPGLKMLTADSPVAARIKSFGENYDNVGFMACGNTHRKMSKKAGKDVVLMPQAKMVPAGVVHLMERQEAGWSYLRP
ncbi:DsrE family protein [Magnetospira sp. QH-2]|uniref:DsrE family protein n=1 Tax=Magnetospira sp. (strain QH-2) TaxID=1288970 RepID=UPI0005F9C187|nr:DsrE family protein [Magnetospira sp. QH-2]